MAERIDEILHQYLTERVVFGTPRELYSLPERTVLEAGRAGGLRSYRCTMNIGAVIYLGEMVRTPSDSPLAIVYRDTPDIIRFSLKSGVPRQASGTGITVTILGVVDAPIGSNYFAFIDSIETPPRSSRR